MKKAFFLFAIGLCLLHSKINAQNYDEPASAGTSGTDNTAVGHNAGANGTYNTSVGKSAGDAVTGSYNSFYGFEAGKTTNNASAAYNIFIGSRAGYSLTSGTNNAFLGYQSGYTSTTAANNTFIGYRAGYSMVTGSGNVFIGKDAGYNETGSNKLYIDNSNTSTPLIKGDFSTNQVAINANTGTYTLNVGGTLNTSSLYVGDVLYKPTQWNSSGADINFATGRVSIGTTATSNGFMLAVAGKMITEELVIKLQSNWPDYVFANDYKLMSLQELQQFIREHHHLPGVPAAKEIESNGVSVGEMNTILLKKIEELSLYIISLEGRLKKIEEKQ